MEPLGSLYCIVPEHLMGRLDKIRAYAETYGHKFSNRKEFSLSHSSEADDPPNISEIQSADAVLVFGVSRRALDEADAARRYDRPLSLHFAFEDPDWRDRYFRLGESFNRLLEGARSYSFLSREIDPITQTDPSEPAQV